MRSRAATVFGKVAFKHIRVAIARAKSGVPQKSTQPHGGLVAIPGRIVVQSEMALMNTGSNRLAWIFIGGFALINGWLLYLTFWSTRFEEAGAAQADFEMFVYLALLGSVVMIGSLLLLVVGYLINIKTLRLNSALLSRPIVAVSLLNIAVPVLLYAYLLMSK